MAVLNFTTNNNTLFMFNLLVFLNFCKHEKPVLSLMHENYKQEYITANRRLRDRNPNIYNLILELP